MGLTEMDMYWMQVALEKAEEAFQIGEVPVGAVLLESSGRHFADRNRTAETGMPVSHAEYLVITAAAEDKGDWRLEGCTLYSTLEPCLMCAGLVVLSRIPRVVYGARDKRFGAFGSVTDVLSMPNLNHYPEVFEGCYANESARLLKEFFRKARGVRSCI